MDSPRLEAELLVGQVLGCNRIQLIAERDQEPNAEQLARLRALVQRRRRHEPVAYLLGEREFYGHQFCVDSRVLVPRPDSETLVEVALRRSAQCSLYGRALDLCTGSGNVALAFSRQRPTWRVDGSDVSHDAIAVARHNAIRLGALWNVRFVHSDLFETPELRAESYELITANPPYIPSDELQRLPRDVRDYEPRVALDGGPDGLDLIRRIVREAAARLSPSGVLAFEIGCDQASASREYLEREGYEDIVVDKDLGGRPRVMSAARPVDPVAAPINA